MSDFLDRLATRAIGDGLLMPRLPSLFEPLAVAPLGSAAMEAFDPPPRSHALPPAIEATAGERGRTTSASVETAPSRASAPATMGNAPASSNGSPARPDVPAQTVAKRSGAGEALQPAPGTHDHAATVSRLEVAQRHEPRITSADAAAPSPSTQRGALLPPPSPVFAASRSNHQPSEHGHGTGAARSRNALADHSGTGPTEPIVHVSIGRLEVRASASSAAPPRRRDGPRPDSLDDYLRQRGKSPP